MPDARALLLACSVRALLLRERAARALLLRERAARLCLVADLAGDRLWTCAAAALRALPVGELHEARKVVNQPERACPFLKSYHNLQRGKQEIGQ